MKQIIRISTCYTQSKTSGTLAFTIPQGVVRKLGIKPGDRFQVSLDDNAIVYEKVN